MFVSRYYEDGTIDAAIRIGDDVINIEPLHRYSGSVR